jgi:hypothetical protein
MGLRSMYAKYIMSLSKHRPTRPPPMRKPSVQQAQHNRDNDGAPEPADYCDACSVHIWRQAYQKHWDINDYDYYIFSTCDKCAK